jgi:BirA family biotin operon repressor/biotin-[acetyl-CoA-carboxylase] ligase
MPAKLDERRLQELLTPDRFVRLLVVLEGTGSTNDDLRRLAAEGAPEGTVVVADHQTSGRGRMGRLWHSSPGLGICVSVLFRPEARLEAIPRFTLGASVAACRACREVSGAPAEIRWPNDVFAGGRKVAGILAEVRSTGPTPGELVVGAGINANQSLEDFPEPLRAVAGSLGMALGGTAVDREALAASFVSRLGEVAGALASDGWGEIASSWAAMSPTSSARRVRVLSAEGKLVLEGTTRGIDDTGALRVEDEAGSITLVRLGESVTFPEG